MIALLISIQYHQKLSFVFCQEVPNKLKKETAQAKKYLVKGWQNNLQKVEIKHLKMDQISPLPSFPQLWCFSFSLTARFLKSRISFYLWWQTNRELVPATSLSCQVELNSARQRHLISSRFPCSLTVYNMIARAASITFISLVWYVMFEPWVSCWADFILWVYSGAGLPLDRGGQMPGGPNIWGPPSWKLQINV